MAKLQGYVTLKPSRHFVRPIWIGRRLGDTQKQVSQFPVRHCEFRTGLRPVPLDETLF